jgi:citrate lyase subunit beta/citryl-CoA lyase
VVAAAEAAQGGAVALDGKMVDRPVILIAQQMLDEARLRAGSK